MSPKSARERDQELIDAIEQFIASTPDMTPSAFGTKALNDPGLVADLKEGRDLRRTTRNRILDFIAARSDAA